MKLVDEVISLLGTDVNEPESCDVESEAFSQLLKDWGIEDVRVNVFKDGTDYIVCLEDDEDKEIFVFGVAEEGDAYCLSTSGIEDPLENEVDVIDLQTVDPKFKEDGSLDMADLRWMNKSVVYAIFSEASEEVEEGKGKIVVRGGKKIKIPIKLRKKILTARQKAGLTKARRKAHTPFAMKSRKFSLKIRKRLGIKKKAGGKYLG